ncbi:phage holin family protein [Variovorax sp. KBS0712]|uniref:phage holin family protein n=1 Tax=Variovorax sp. KBS0712 TaxID=2578111 RepID=UPI001119DB57|nr:phage holin family protein [Variovorax sp. KBS0712]TSD56429.1 phage holin family protein [Variovorax sp. KBS0712]
MQEELDNLAVGVATIFLDGLRTLLFTIPMLFLAAGVLLAWGGPVLWLYGIAAALMGAIALLYLILAIWRRLRAAFSKPPAPMKPSAERYVQRARARLPAGSFVDAKPKARSREIYALLDETLRPTAGKALFSYTDAWMTVTKMFAGGTMSREQMKRIAGEKMVSYHLKQGNLEVRDGAIALSSKGYTHFIFRKVSGHAQSVDPDQVAGWVRFFSTGTFESGGTKACSGERLVLQTLP